MPLMTEQIFLTHVGRKPALVTEQQQIFIEQFFPESKLDLVSERAVESETRQDKT